MAKKATPARNTKTTKSTKEIASTPVRNSAIPKTKVAQPKVVKFEDIALRAYLISQSPECRSQDENWLRAERELKGL